MASHPRLHPITIPDLAYSPISPSEPGYSSPAESDTLRTPEQPHQLLAFTRNAPDAAEIKLRRVDTREIINDIQLSKYDAVEFYSSLLSSLDISRVQESSPSSSGEHDCSPTISSPFGALSPPISPNEGDLSSSPSRSPESETPENSEHRAQYSLPSCSSKSSCSHFSLDSSLYSSHFPNGHQLNPHFARIYELEDELGSGGYGFVMTARNRHEGHEVAVKFIIKEKVPQHAWMDHDLYGRLPTEVMLLSMMDHENIVKCLDLYEDSRYFYLVQELHGSPWQHPRKSWRQQRSPPLRPQPSIPTSLPLLSASASADSISSLSPSTPSQTSNPVIRVANSAVEDSDQQEAWKPEALLAPRPRYSRRPSHDLFECIEQSEHKHLSESQARRVFAQIVEAVYYLHSIGVVHRDIKDENIVIDKDLKVKLIDFGSATFVEPAEPRPYYDLFYGTTAYAASEILLKKAYQAAPAEIWTLGVLLSYLLTGTSPFPTAKDAVAGKIVLIDCPPVSRLAMDLMHCCLDPNPKTRATIEEVKAHLWLKQTRGQ